MDLKLAAEVPDQSLPSRDPVSSVETSQLNGVTSSAVASYTGSPQVTEDGPASSLLPAGLCESVLNQPSRYLEDVPIFGIDETDETQHTHIPNTNIDLSERMTVLEPASMGSSGFSARAGSSTNCLPGITGDIAEAKDAKVELVNSVPCLVSEDGVVFQCFPISEKEMIIVSVNDNALLVNESLTGQLSVTESASGGSGSYLKVDTPNAAASRDESDNSVKKKDAVEIKGDSFVLDVSSQPCSLSSIILPPSGPSEGVGIPTYEVAKLSELTQLPPVSHTAVTESILEPSHEDSYSQDRSSPSGKRKLKSILERTEEAPDKRVKVTHATIYAPLPCKVKNVARSEEEGGGSDWVRCCLCSDSLPSMATLRHHLITSHKQTDIKSYQCFLCDQECWSARQEEWHLRVHHGIKNPAVACRVCGAQLATLAECRAHLRKHPATFSCPTCPLKFRARYQLMSHAQSHTDELLPHWCLMCGAAFAHSATLNFHCRRHTHHPCPVQTCSHTVVDESWLLAHLRHQHTMPHSHLTCITAREDTLDQLMDKLIGKYTYLSQFHTSDESCTPPESHPINTSPNHHTSDTSLNIHNPDTSLNIHTSGISLPVNIHTSDSSLNIHTSHNSLDPHSIHQASYGTHSPLDQNKKSHPGVLIPALVNDESQFQDDYRTCVSVVNNLVETVVSVVEEEGSENTGEDQPLQKTPPPPPQQQSGLYRCGLCNVYLPTAQELATHKAGHNQPVLCVKCDKSFLSVKQLKRHMTVHSSQDATTTSTQDMADNVHQCLECGRVCGSESALSRHHGTHARSIGRHQCSVCHRRVRTRHHLTEHMARVHKINAENKKLQCPMCDRHFTSKTHLDTHLVSHGEGRSSGLWCRECGRRFVRPRSFQHHLASHRRTHTCPTCDQSFTSARALTVHARTHHPTHTEKLSCSECPQRFAYASQLAVHMRVHTGERPYQCETCGKSFKRLQQCRAHQRMIHGSQRETCVECGKTFGDKTNLLRHRLMVHYHLKRWVCGVCGQSYAYSQDLRNHLGKQHNLKFHRINPGTRKSRHEVYVVPELPGEGVNQLVETACEVERGKVERVLASTQNGLRHQHNTTAADTDDPDDPTAGERDIPHTLQPPPPAPTITLPALAPLPPIPALAPLPSFPALDGSEARVSYKHDGSGGGEGVVGVGVGVRCAQCGVGVEGGLGLHCGGCGAGLCSQPHMELHMAASHRGLYQCSLCVLGYPGQEGVLAAPTVPPLLALQGDGSTLLPAQPLSVQVGGGGQTLGVVQSQTGPGPGTGIQPVPLVLAPQTPAHGSVVLQCPTTSILPTVSVIPQAPVQDTAKFQDKQTVITMTDLLSHNPPVLVKSERKEKEELGQGSVREHDSSLTLLPLDGGPLASLTNGSGIAGSGTQPTDNLDTTLILGGSGGGGDSTIHTNPASVLVMAPLPQDTAPPSPTDQLHNKECVEQPASTSMASVLLTLASPPPQPPPHQDPPTLTPPASTPPQTPPALLVASIPRHKQHKDTGGDGAGDMLDLQQLQEEPSHHPASPTVPSSDQQAQVADESLSIPAGPPQEVSVEIIQPRPRRSKVIPAAVRLSSRSARDGDGGESKGRDNYKCPTCNKTFQSPAHLTRHQRTHDSHRHSCPTCSKTFTEKYNLKTHMLTHTRERPHSCPLCHKNFRYLRDLTEHKRTHEGLRPHHCSVCHLRFLRRRDYMRHYKEQHCNERHQCKVCGASFKRRIYLEMVHMRTHHPIPGQAKDKESRPDEASASQREVSESREAHICRTCGKTFARARYLTSHMRTHSRRADYIRCPRCPRMFTSERTLKVHKETFHDRDLGSSQDTSCEVEDNRAQDPATTAFFSKFNESQHVNSSNSKPSVRDQAGLSNLSSSSSSSLDSSNLARRLGCVEPGTGSHVEVSHTRIASNVGMGSHVGVVAGANSGIGGRSSSSSLESSNLSGRLGCGDVGTGSHAELSQPGIDSSVGTESHIGIVDSGIGDRSLTKVESHGEAETRRHIGIGEGSSHSGIELGIGMGSHAAVVAGTNPGIGDGMHEEVGARPHIGAGEGPPHAEAAVHIHTTQKGQGAVFSWG